MIITPILISKNAQNTIYKTLNSLIDFKEVVVLDTGSTDNTMKIARQFSNVKLFQSTFSGFGKCKNEAAQLASSDWVLSIDADEVLTPELIQSIKKTRLQNDIVYRWRRCNFYKNKEIRYSGWGKDYIIRLYNKKTTCFKEKLVHEYIESEGLKVETLKGCMNHFSYHSISDFNRKRELYSDLFATENKGKRKSSSLIAFLHASFAFFSTYLLRRGLLDGYMGLLIAVSNANETFLKYIKLYEANLEVKFTKTPIAQAVFEPKPDKIPEPAKRIFALEFLHPSIDNNLSASEKKKSSLLFLHEENKSY